MGRRALEASSIMVDRNRDLPHSQRRMSGIEPIGESREIVGFQYGAIVIAGTFVLAGEEEAPSDGTTSLGSIVHTELISEEAL